MAAQQCPRDASRPHCAAASRLTVAATLLPLLPPLPPDRPPPRRLAEETFDIYFDKQLEGVTAKGQHNATDMDIVSSMGERLSNFMIAQYIRSVAGDNSAAYIPGDEVVITDGIPGNSTPLLGPTRELMQAKVLPLLERGTVPMITGFFGRSQDGLLTTFGRGGSDLTAALVGHCLDAAEVALYKVEYNKDDEGFLQEWAAGWEGIVHDADVTTTIPRITYQVAAELAHFGKKVLHPDTVGPAIEKSIDVRVLNSLNHEHPGTTIGAPDNEEAAMAAAIAAAAAKDAGSDSETDGVVSTIAKARLSDYERTHAARLDLAIEGAAGDDSDWAHPSEQSTLIAMVGLNVMEHKEALLSRIESDLRAAGIQYAVPKRVNGSKHNVTIVVPASRTQDALGILHSELVVSQEGQVEEDVSSDDSVRANARA